jgi:uncharacterized membrane protein
MSAIENLRDDAAGVVVLLVLGAGFLALFAGFDWFWMVWVVGFAVLLPLVAIATGEAGEADEESEPAATGEPAADPLDRLRERYAEGELTDGEFERRLERLLETEDDGAATAYVERTRRERAAEPERDRE